MKKFFEISIIIIITLIVTWGAILIIDCVRCKNLKMPIFVVPAEIADDGGSGTYYGLGYKVKIEKSFSAEQELQIIKTEMYMFNKMIAGAVTDIKTVKAIELETTEGITTVLTLEDEITNDTIWCGTLQLIWNDLKNDLAKQDIVFTPQLQVVENLNKETFTISELSEEDYYKKIGWPSLELKAEIEQAIKDKFNETSDILDDFEWDGHDPEDYFLYVMLKKEFEFKTAFEELENGNFGQHEDIKFFGIKSDKTGELAKQVQVLYYNSKNDFAIKLKTKQVDEIILCKNPEGNTFNEIYENIKKQEEKYNGQTSLQEGEKLKIPNLEMKEKNELVELQNKPFYFANGQIYEIEKAMQSIEFELDKKGGKIKSEAGMMVQKESLVITENREFLIDDTFAIFLIEKDKSLPYFAAKINDITKFQ